MVRWRWPLLLLRLLLHLTNNDNHDKCLMSFSSTASTCRRWRRTLTLCQFKMLNPLSIQGSTRFYWIRPLNWMKSDFVVIDRLGQCFFCCFSVQCHTNKAGKPAKKKRPWRWWKRFATGQQSAVHFSIDKSLFIDAIETQKCGQNKQQWKLKREKRTTNWRLPGCERCKQQELRQLQTSEKRKNEFPLARLLLSFDCYENTLLIYNSIRNKFSNFGPHWTVLSVSVPRALNCRFCNHLDEEKNTRKRKMRDSIFGHSI